MNRKYRNQRISLERMGNEHHERKREESSRCRKPMEDSDWKGMLSGLKTELSSMDSGQVQPLVHRIAQSIHWLDDHMTKYCVLTCPSCDDPCCRGLEVFYNWTDLIFLAAREGEPPPGQTRTRSSEPCRYLGRNGCQLPRLLRPYVCVWFICDAQMKYFGDEPATFQRQFIGVLQNIRNCRLELEAFYERHLEQT